MHLSGKLEILVYKGYDLPNLDASKFRKSDDKSDPYVIVKLVNDKKKELKISKTKVIDNCLNPVWNHNINHFVNEEVEEIKFDIYDKDKIMDDKIGTAIVNVNAFNDSKPFENQVPVFNKKGSRAGFLAVKITFYKD